MCERLDHRLDSVDVPTERVRVRCKLALVASNRPSDDVAGPADRSQHQVTGGVDDLFPRPGRPVNVGSACFEGVTVDGDSPVGKRARAAVQVRKGQLESVEPRQTAIRAVSPPIGSCRYERR